ncbi:MAG: GNAT family N-acetyltransferase [Lachnospiraceae bacterium]|nr:GNAT family N-acetyltransferase [Lachnospiraceae bacterium]
MSNYVIINDLSNDEQSQLYNEFPPDKYRYVKVADMVKASWQPFFDADKTIGIAKSDESISILEAHDIAVLGYESTEDEILSSAYVVGDLGVVEKRDLDIVYSRFHKTPLIILETKRCIIREHTVDDYDAIRDIYDDEDMTEYIEPLFEPEEEKVYLNNYIEYIYKLFGYGLWLIVDKASNEVIGRAGVETREICKDKSQVELSYQVKKEYQGKGIATEVCRQIIDYTFNILKKDSIIARVDKGNLASVRLMDKLGFSLLEDGLYIKYANN